MGINLTSTQKQIVQHGEGALFVVAGPGSGKTRVLTERIRRLLNESKGHFKILALTFTNKAANEMKERLIEFPDIDKRAFIGSIHSFCTMVLANRGKSVGVDQVPNIFESYQDRLQVLLDSAMENEELKYILMNKENMGDREKQLSKWLDMISDAKNKLKMPELISNEINRKVYMAYNSGLRASNVLDFDDLLLLTYRLFLERPEIADFYRRQYRYICIDEAQDLNEAQYQLLRALCGPNYDNVMMVGDPKQAIFVWNGADPKYLDFFERDFNAKKIIMNENFRSSKAVVAVAKSLNPEYEIEGTIPIGGSVDILVGKDEKEEANLVLNYIKNLINNGHKDVEGNITWEKCAILGRNRYVHKEMEEELKNREIPYYKQLSSQHESESNIIQDFEMCLHIFANPHDRIHLGLLLKRWGLSIDYDKINIDDPSTLFDELEKNVVNNEHKVVLEAIKIMQGINNNFKFLKSIDFLNNHVIKNFDDNEKALAMEDINIWQKHWDFYLRSTQGGHHELSSFLVHVALGTTQQPKQDGLALLTIHSAKGLEFDIIAIMGMAEGIFPDYRAKGDDLVEEKRNAFVAVTRSRRILLLSYSKTKKMPWGDIWQQKPSRYLFDMGQIKN